MLSGKVYLVGAGPGDPGLITVKGLDLLKRADVVAYDRLIPHELLIDRAQKGLLVVRLKGGDPFVFGRGGEEALACHEAGVPFEVVPGVSSAIAVPAYAGVPVTQRLIASAFTVFTGHEDPTKPES